LLAFGGVILPWVFFMFLMFLPSGLHFWG
jgi:hypothetical protein